MNPDEYTYPISNLYYENTIKTIALHFTAEAAADQKADAIDWLIVSGNNKKTSRSPHCNCKIVDDGARALAKPFKVLRCAATVDGQASVPRHEAEVLQRPWASCWQSHAADGRFIAGDFVNKAEIEKFSHWHRGQIKHA